MPGVYGVFYKNTQREEKRRSMLCSVNEAINQLDTAKAKNRTIRRVRICRKTHGFKLISDSELLLGHDQIMIIGMSWYRKQLFDDGIGCDLNLHR